jgi:hypothetical protein
MLCSRCRILRIVYLTHKDAVSKGHFYPNGVNGNSESTSPPGG